MLGFRQSKFKHIYGQGVKKELCYDNVRVTKNAWDSNLIKVNPLYFSVNWDSAGGGAFAVIPLNERGKLPDLIPLFKGHSGPVLDTDFNPFNDSVLASASEDGKICLWQVPSDFTVLEKNAPDISPISKLTGHSRKVGNVTWHPSADNVMASTSGDYTLKLWDVIKSSSNLTLKHPDIIQSLSFNRDGNSLVTTCRDKRIRIWDPRMGKVAQEAPGHAGAKNSRSVYINGDRVATAGFGKMSDRQLGLWDVKNLTEPLGGFTNLDQSAGVIMPFYDYDTKVLYLAGKGDGNIRYYEFENDEFWPLAEYKSSDPQRGVAFMPKRALSVHENEVMRAYKTVRDQLIEPVAFIVPRRSEAFQDDIYPDTLSGEPSLTSDEWFAGGDAPLQLLSMESVFRHGVGGQPSRKRDFTPMDSDSKAVSQPESVLKKATSQPEPVPKKVATQVDTVPKKAPEIASPSKSSTFPTDKPHSAPVKEQPPKEEPIKEQPIKRTQSQPQPKAVENVSAKDSPSVEAPALSTDTALQRLLNLVEAQSQTIESQAKRIELLEEQQGSYLQALKGLEAKLNSLPLSEESKASETLEDDDGTFVEV